VILVNKLISLSAVSPSYHSFSINITNGPEIGVFSGEIFCPLVTRQHPDIESIQTVLHDYFLSKEVFSASSAEERKFEKSVFAYLVGFTCPHDSFEEVLEVSKHVGWLFKLDNKIDEPGSVFRVNPELLPDVTDILYAAAADAAGIPKSPVKGLFEPIETVRHSSMGLPEQFLEFSPLVSMNIEMGTRLRTANSEHFLVAHDGYLQAICRESLNRKHGEWMTVDGYKDLRKHTSAVTDVLEFIWVLNDIKLNHHIRNNLDFISMIKNANLFVSYVNDLFSLNNEIKEGTRENIVRVIQHNRKCSLGEAVHETIELMNSSARDFIVSKAKFSQTFRGRFDEKEVAGKAIQYAEHLMIGNLHWSKLTGRYKEAE